MFGRRREPDPPEITEEEVKKFEAPEVKKPEPVKPAFTPAAATKIGEGITMIGNFDTKDPVEINGTLRGNIRSTSSVAISKNGSLIGEAALDSMKVDGRIDGTVLCNASAVFTSTGSMKGNLSTGTLRTDAGSNFEGKLNMIPKKPKPAPAPAPKAEEPLQEAVGKAAQEAETAAHTAAAQAKAGGEPVYETLADAIRAKEAAQKATNR